MAIKINLMPEAQKKGWQIPQRGSYFFSISGLLFAISLVSFLGIYTYKNYFLQKKLDDLKKQDSSLTQEISNSFSPDLYFLSKKAESTQTLLKDHLYWSKYFEALESFTLKNIHYDQFSVKSDSAKSTVLQADISGYTDNFNTLSKQIAIFMGNKDISSVKFDGGEMDKDGKVKFKISLNISQEFLKEKNNK